VQDNKLNLSRNLSGSELRRRSKRLRKKNNSIGRDKDARDRANRESIAAQLKLYGDIVKNVKPKFPSDFADNPIFFESIENYSVVLKFLSNFMQNYYYLI